MTGRDRPSAGIEYRYVPLVITAGGSILESLSKCEGTVTDFDNGRVSRRVTDLTLERFLVGVVDGHAEFVVTLWDDTGFAFDISRLHVVTLLEGSLTVVSQELDIEVIRPLIIVTPDVKHRGLWLLRPSG